MASLARHAVLLALVLLGQFGDRRPASLLAAQSPPPPDSALAGLLASVDPARPATVRAFWDSIAARGTPILERIPGDSTRVRASFVFRDDTAKNVLLENGVNGWAYVMNVLERVPGTDIWHKTVDVPADIRLGYVFRVNDNLIPWHLEPDQATRWRKNRPDPFNARVDSAQGQRSLIIGPLARPDEWSMVKPGVRAGRIQDAEVPSRAYSGVRKVSVYTPPGGVGDGLPLLVIFDGPVYRNVVRVPTIMDNLIAAGEIGPAIVVFVNQVSRNDELEPNERFTQFVADELIPWIRERYRTSGEAARTILAGSSHGGLAAISIALARPDRIGGVIAQSPSLWWSPPGDPEPEYHARLMARSQHSPIRFWLEVGRFEIDRTRGGRPGQVDVSRHFRDVLVAKGYEVRYNEFSGGHEYHSWRITLPEAIRYLLRL